MDGCMLRQPKADAEKVVSDLLNGNSITMTLQVPEAGPLSVLILQLC